MVVAATTLPADPLKDECLSPSAIAEAKRILDREARRLLAVQLETKT